MTYSCGIFAQENTTMEEHPWLSMTASSSNKKSSGQTVLEIGCGWGGFAKRLLETTDAKWTGTTISATV